MSTSASYRAPSTLPELLRLLRADAAAPVARPLAGGSDLIVQRRAGRVAPGR